MRAGELFIHSTTAFTMDTIMWAARWAWSNRAVVAGEPAFAIRGRISSRCIAVGDTFEALNNGERRTPSRGWKIAGSRVRSVRPQRKRSWRLCWREVAVLKSEGNLNNEYGLPLTLFRLEETYQGSGAGDGMSRRGRADPAGAIARPMLEW